MKYTQKILVLFSHIDQTSQSKIEQGIQNWIDFLAQKPELADYTLSIVTAESNATYRTITGSNPDGSEVIYADPIQIIEEAENNEIANHADYDAICLFYNDNYIVGNKPNHPVDVPIYTYGFNTFSIPLAWVSNLNDNTKPFTVYPDAVELMFSHENCHADYFLINTRGGLTLHDRTHDLQNLSDANPSQIYGFRDYLIELTPYWKFLVTAEGERMLVFFYVKGNQTRWSLVEGQWIGFSDGAAYTNYIGGRKFVEIGLDQTEFNKLSKNPEVFKS